MLNFSDKGKSSDKEKSLESHQQVPTNDQQSAVDVPDPGVKQTLNCNTNEKVPDIHQHIPTNEQQSTVDVPGTGVKKKKKVRSESQNEASRRNGKRSPGPGNTERTRYNALRHGLRAEALTPWDDAEEYERNIDALKAIYRSSNPLDIFVIEQSAKDMVRIRRMDRLEAENICAMSSRPDTPDEPSSHGGTPTIHFAMMKEYGGQVLDIFNRYTTAAMNRLRHNRRELERIPRDET